jgi:cysteinyl-tRNA synthetase
MTLINSQFKNLPFPGQRQMEWSSPWGLGFPGWHIECSAMSMKYLGEQFDIHCGGIDHIPVHHTNEIAQSESATGKKPWVKYWMHNEFVNMGADKMSKSLSNFITLQTLKERGISPIAYRYWLLQTHYRKQLTFSWEALDSAKKGLEHLYEEAAKLRIIDHRSPIASDQLSVTSDRFLQAINDDLNTPEALALIWTAITNKQINYSTLLDFDKVLGLGIKASASSADKLKHENIKTVVPDEVQKLLDARAEARKQKNWSESDRLRDEIKKFGWEIEDTKDGQILTNIDRY